MHQESREAVGRAWSDPFLKSHWLVRVLALSLSLAFAVALAIGGVAVDPEGFDGIVGAGWVLVGLEAIVNFVALGLVLLPLLHYSMHYRPVRGVPGIGVWASRPWRRRILMIAALVAPWSIYWVFLWPGITSNDSFNQILQAWGVTEYSDHHPILQTLAIQAVFAPALALTGRPELAIAVVSLVQMISLAVIVALCVDALRRFNPPAWILWATIVLFALHPLTGWYSVTLWKDVWLATLVLAGATMMAVIFHKIRSEIVIPWHTWLLFFIVLVALMSSKKTGIFIVLPMVLFVAIFLRRKPLVRWLSVGLGAVMAYIGLHAAVMFVLDVAPGRENEAWSLPVQQIARVVDQHGVELDDREKARVEKFFPGADLAELYRPNVSDPVKAALSAEALSENRMEFIDLWTDLGRSYPVTFAEAFVDQTYGYWYPGVQYWMVTGLDWESMVELNGNTEKTRFLKDLTGGDYFVDDQYRYAASTFINEEIRDTFAIGILFSLGAWVWATMILGAIAILRRQFEAVAVLLVSGLVWLSSMLSPVYAEARYLYPMFLLLPLLAVLTFRPRDAHGQEVSHSESDQGHAL